MADLPDWTDVGDRIRAARMAIGWSQAQLADAVGLDRTMVAKIEAGSRRVDALELARLSAALAVPMAHFLDDQPAVLSRRTVTLTDDNETEVGRESSKLDMVLGGWLRDLRQLVDLGRLTPRPPMRYPDAVRSAEDARRAAGWLRDRLDLGVEPIASFLATCERAGQFVLVTGLPGEGASALDGDLAAAVVSDQGDPGRRRATAAHELGHLVLGDEYSSDLGVHASRADRESVIDAFAAEFLLPMAIFRRDVESGVAVTRARLVQVAASYRASWSLAIRQAQAARAPVPAKWAQRSPTRAEFLDALGWAPQPDLESIRVPPAVAHAVMQAWRDSRITRRRAAELMHGQIDEGDLPQDVESDLAP